MIRVVPILLLFASNLAHAAPADFARGRVIETIEATALQRATVPQDVYEWIVRSDLGDLRVYNATHDEVPYTIRRPAGTETHTPWVELPVFKLPAVETVDGTGANVNIELGDSGAVVAVHGAPVRNQPSAGYLIDASAYTMSIAEIDVDWSQENGGIIGKFQVQVSDDLDVWRTTIDSTTLATLETGGRRIVVDKIALRGVSSRYLKISQLDGATPMIINRVSVRALRSQLPERDWKTLSATSDYSGKEAGYEFDTGGRFPLDRVSLELDKRSYLITARLFSKRSAEDKWIERGERTFYRVDVDGTLVTSDPIAYSIRDRYWRAEILNEENLSPTLKIGWLPDEVVFLKQGNAPFLLAYGQADTTGRQWPMQDLLRRLDNGVEIQNVQLSNLSAANQLGGPSRLLPPSESVDWETVLLWAVLVIGVACIVFLAVRLVRSTDGD